MKNLSHKTAIKRTKVSAPAKYIWEHELVFGTVLDYGCGRGFDAINFGFDKYDPHYFPEYPTGNLYDFVVCNYVLNVLPKEDWSGVIENIISLLKPGGIAYISVRNDKKNLKGFTSKGTYQVFVELDLPIERKTNNFVMYKVVKNG